MKLVATIGTMKISFENEQDLLEKLLKEKESLEKIVTQIQADWEKAEKSYKDKIKPFRRNLTEMQESILKLKGKQSGGQA